MAALHTLDVRLYQALAYADLSPVEVDRVVDLCDFVVGFLTHPDGPYLPHPGRAARSSARACLTERTNSPAARTSALDCSRRTSATAASMRAS